MGMDFDKMFGNAQNFIPDPKDIEETEKDFGLLDAEGEDETGKEDVPAAGDDDDDEDDVTEEEFNPEVTELDPEELAKIGFDFDMPEFEAGEEKEAE